MSISSSTIWYIVCDLCGDEVELDYDTEKEVVRYALDTHWAV